MPKTSTRFPVKASVLALAIMGLPHFANAAGIGKLTVLSALGQPLRAEIEVSATKDELNSLAAKIATQEQFRQQGMDFNAAVASLNLTVEKRANGQAYVRMTSDRPINEPFLDVLVELSWASGRLVREYTFLLDPVELPRPATASVTAPGVTAVAAQAVPTVVETTKPAKQSKASKNVSATKPEPTPKVEAAPQPAPPPKVEPAAPTPKIESVAATSGTGREVKRGDTLGKIASETAPDGVSLDQMMVALFSANRDAFIGENINRLKTGRILNVPDREAATAVSDSEARKTIAIHAQNFNAYRQKLAEAAAGGAPVEAASAQSSSGKITPKVEDKAPAPIAGKDKLEVSKNEASKAGAKAAAAAEEDKIAREKALKEAQSRVAELEKNVADLKKLNEVKSQSLAAAEKQAQAAKAAAPAAAPVVAAKPVEPAKPEPTKPVEVAKTEAPKVEPAKVEEPKPAPVAEPAKPAEAEAPAAKPAEATPPPPPKKPVVVLPDPEPEPTFMEEFGPFVYLGGALVALLGGFFGFREWKRRKSMDLDASSQFGETSSTSSVFGTTGGQSVDTNNVSMASGFSQTSLSGDEGTAGVDPVAEAEVYMAYGRDAQAEEILLEAIKAEPTRQAVHLKLLELYAARKSIKPFEEVARDLKEQTGGAGPNWDKAAALGQGIDPGNPLYSGAPKAGEGLDDTGAFGAFGTSTVIMPPGQLAKMAAEGFDPSTADTLVIDTADAPVVEEAVADASEGFDLDLGAAEPVVEMTAPEAVTLDFDLDLGADDSASANTDIAALDLEVPSISPEPASAAPALDIEFDLDLPAPTPAVETPAASMPGNSVDFDFNLDAPAAEPVVEAAAGPDVGSLAPTVDFSAISLDLDTPAATPEPAPAVDATPPVIEIPSADEDDNPEVTTKLELAQAYEEMGDKEGMRELLQEVLAEGNAAQQELARNKLAEHGL